VPPELIVPKAAAITAMTAIDEGMIADLTVPSARPWAISSAVSRCS